MDTGYNQPFGIPTPLQIKARREYEEALGEWHCLMDYHPDITPLRDRMAAATLVGGWKSSAADLAVMRKYRKQLIETPARVARLLQHLNEIGVYL